MVDVEPPPVGNLVVENGDGGSSDDDEARASTPAPWPSRMRRSEACYDIAQQLSTSSQPVRVPDSPRRSASSSKCSESPPSPPSATADGCSTDTDSKPAEDLVSEEEKALEALDAIAYDYDDHHEEVLEPTDTRGTSSI